MKRLTIATIALLLSAPVLADIDEGSEAIRGDIFAVAVSSERTAVSVSTLSFNLRHKGLIAAISLSSEKHKQVLLDHEYRKYIRPYAAQHLQIAENVVNFYPFSGR